jgi:hypothetical protein
VREIVSILDIDVLFYPTPKNGPNFRPKVVELGGKRQFPYMVRGSQLADPLWTSQDYNEISGIC